MSEGQIGFIGAGKMATALARGMIQSGFRTAQQIVASDVVPEVAEAFRKSTSARTVSSNQEVLRNAEIVFLAVKPQVVPAVLKEIQSDLQPGHLVVSIAAGVTLAQLEAALPEARIIRVMPNTPCLVGAGASAYAKGKNAIEGDAQLVRELLTTVGIALEVPESQLDTVTGLSGSGPAYAFEMIEALSDGGVLMGLNRTTATKLAAQTLLGAARMVLESGEHPGQLKDGVTSPGGTTIAGLHILEKSGLRGALMTAVQAATERARELSQS